MPVEMHVSDVRKHLLVDGATEASAGDHAVIDAELFVLFQEIVAFCFTPGSPIYLLDVLEDVDPDATAWQSAIVDTIYRRLVGPRLERHRAVWHQCPGEIATLWRAIENLAAWLTKMLLDVRRRHGSLHAARDLIDCARQLRVELREPGWRDTVVLHGAADAVLRVPHTHTWCVVLLRAGAEGASLKASLAVAALYRLLLSGGGAAAHDLTMVAFADGFHEKAVSATRLQHAEVRLKEAIGRIAGVVADEGRPHAPADWKAVSTEHRKMRETLLRVLGNYGLKATVDELPRLGPTFIRFLVTPATGAKVSRFTNLVEEIALGMNLKHLPLVERSGDRIIVDVERPDRRSVRFEDLRDALPPPDPLFGNSRMLVGVDMDGGPVFIDLAKPEHCHVLVVGTAGSGKSIWMRAAIASLVVTNVPGTLQLVLIDPKRNAFTAWQASPFLREPIVFPGETSPADVLAGLIEEMESRYKRMAEAEVDDLRGLIRHENRCTPRIVCACDEYADLISTSEERKDIEKSIARLGAKARAAGIHLILATQTPRREIIGGTIKANLPTCVGLRVSSEAEAKVIETPGAEMLLGNGDLLLRSIGEPLRLQGVLLSSERRSPTCAVAGG